MPQIVSIDLYKYDVPLQLDSQYYFGKLVDQPFRCVVAPKLFEMLIKIR